jgi:hypothetical protein
MTKLLKKQNKSNEQISLIYSYQSFQTYIQTSNKDGAKTIKKESVVTEMVKQ